MPMVMITKKNIGEHTKKVIAKKRFRHAGNVVEVGDVLILSDYNLYDSLDRKLVELYKEPAPVIQNDNEEIPKKTRKRKTK
jgi:hypothetical protein